MELSLEDLLELLKTISKLDRAEIEVTVGDAHVAVRKTAGKSGQSEGSAPMRPLAVAADPPGQPTAASDNEARAVTVLPASKSVGSEEVEEWLRRENSGEAAIVRSPMVGTFYKASAPGAAPYVEEGSVVKDEDVVCLVEVMKLFHSVTAGVRGTVRKVFVEDASLVEYLQPLIAIEKTLD